MRWGVTDELANDHQVSALCLAEVRRCQQLSRGPYFVVCIFHDKMFHISMYIGSCFFIISSSRPTAMVSSYISSMIMMLPLISCRVRAEICLLLEVYHFQKPQRPVPS